MGKYREIKNLIKDLIENLIVWLSCFVGFYLIEFLGVSIEFWVELCLMVFVNLGLIDSFKLRELYFLC